MIDAFKNQAGESAQVQLDENDKVPVVVGPFDYRNIQTIGTFILKVGEGVLHTITINNPVANGVIQIYDNNEAGGPLIGTITTPAVYLTYTATYDIAFTGGLTIRTSVAAQDITVTYK